MELGAIAVDGKQGSASSKRLRGLVNIVRVGYTHASTSKLIKLNDEDAVELASEFLASRQITDEVRKVCAGFSLNSNGG